MSSGSLPRSFHYRVVERGSQSSMARHIVFSFHLSVAVARCWAPHSVAIARAVKSLNASVICCSDNIYHGSTVFVLPSPE